MNQQDKGKPSQPSESPGESGPIAAAHPADDDSHSGSVPLQNVITVLQACGVSFKCVDDGTSLVLYNNDGVPEGLVLPALVRRRMLHRITNKYAGLKIEWFYHPEMVCRGPKTAQ